MELYANMGFEKNPFTKFSAEEEKNYLKDIYEKPRFYPTILDELIEGNSRYLFGERGVGKSALMLYLIGDLKDKGVYTVLIDEYDGTPIQNNGSELLCLAEKNIVTQIGIDLLLDKKRVKKLQRNEKEKLAYLINNYFKSMSRDEVKELYEKISGEKKKNLIRRIVNVYVIKTINALLSGASGVVGATISNALGLPKIDNKAVYMEFFPELKEKEGEENSENSYIEIKGILKETAILIRKMGYKNLVVFFDKLDEYTMLKSRIDQIVTFIEPLTTDTSLIYSSEFGLEFLLWIKLKDKMKEKQVRFDKARPIDIDWSEDELKRILSRRLSFFSKNRIKVENIFYDSTALDKVIELANGSPRQLTMLLGRIYDEQAKMDGTERVFSEEAVKQGMENFCTHFEYDLFYPNNKIKEVVNRILKLGKVEFTIKDLAQATKKSIPAATNYVGTMKNVGFVVETIGDISGNAKVYKVIEPKIKYMIEKDLKYVG